MSNDVTLVFVPGCEPVFTENGRIDVRFPVKQASPVHDPNAETSTLPDVDASHLETPFAGFLGEWPFLEGPEQYLNPRD